VATARRDIEAASPGHTWWPGLEGLRAPGLIVVLIYHQDSKLVPGGYFSVSMFFTLSGFLITSLLMREQDRSGRIAVRRFWARRVRRLLPVAAIGLAFAAFVAWATRGEALLPSVGSDIRWAALNLANWRFIHEDASYAAALTDPSTVTHYWSLAIEEQYYLVYPVVALLALRWGGRRGLGLVLAGVTVASFAAQLAVGGGDRAYFGTDTRLAEIAIGGLAAVLWTPRVREAVGRRIDVAAALVAPAVVLLWWRLPLDSPRVFDGALLLHAVVISVIVIAVTEGGPAERLASWRPAVWLGGLSYATYVVHFPMYLLLDADRTGLHGVALLAVRVAATLGSAWVLTALVERPVRFGGAFRAERWHAPVAAVSAIGIVLLAATAMPEVGRDDTALEAAFAPDLPTSVTAPVRTVDSLPPVESTAPSTTATGAPTTRPTPTTLEAPRALKLLMAGDSTAGVWADGWLQWAEDTGYASPDRTGGPGCVLHQEGFAALRPGWLYQPDVGCTVLPDLIVADAKRSKVDVVILMIGSMELSDWVPSADALPTSILEPGFAARYRATFDRALDILTTQLDVPILVATVPGPRWNPEEAPGIGDLTMNSVVRARRFNEINASVVAEHPRARMVPFAEAVDLADGWIDPRLHTDGLHVDPDEVPALLDGELGRALRAAYQSVIAAEPGLRRPGATIWWP
jgi:peptidoglycan/LPS O-acetylase OafA/YrhL